jgi:Phosphopantetheine attachment site.
MREKVIEILNGLRPEFDFSEDVNFIEEGMLDSLDLVNLVERLEQEYSIEIDGLDIITENFSSLEGILNLLKKSGAEE